VVELVRLQPRDPGRRGARGCVRAITRAEAEAHFARLGGDDLPGEPALRALFGADSSFASPPLRLGSGTAAAGYRETRVYRLLLADEPRSLAELQSTWPMRAVSDGRVVGTVDRAIGRDALRWDLRHIGPGAAWCVDLTVNLAGDDDGVIDPVLRELTAVMRGQGMIPVTIERFS